MANNPSAPLPLEDRVAIVTGASRGIGRAIATHLASLGARLVLGYAANSSLADSLADSINSSSSSSSNSPTPPRAVTARVDVSIPEDVKAMFDLAEQTFDANPHIFVNSAGVLDSKYPHLAATTIEDFDSTFAVNTRGAFLCLREASTRLVRGGGGRIVMVTSSLVGQTLPGYGAYTASKAAVELMAKVSSRELAGTGITVNCVAPGPVATDMFFLGKTEETIRMKAEICPMKRLGKVDDIAPVVGFLCTDEGEWINGQVLRVNGGLS